MVDKNGCNQDEFEENGDPSDEASDGSNDE